MPAVLLALYIEQKSVDVCADSEIDMHAALLIISAGIIF
jgi:hypothetical protein